MMKWNFAGNNRPGARRGWFAGPLALLATLGTLNSSCAAPPLIRTHAHNDYEHARPLQDALDLGFCSVEADIYLVSGQLLVAHDRDKVKPDRTLERLYLEPLRDRVRATGGHVYPEFATNAPVVEFTLLIDIKQDAAAVYPVLRELLSRYSDIVTEFTASNCTPRAVTVILSGERPVELVTAESRRWCALDGKLDDMSNNPSPQLYPLISDNWRTIFPTTAAETLTSAQREELRRYVAQAHAQGRRLRFWGAPDRVETWRELYGAGVDLLGADDLSGLAAFLRHQTNAPAPVQQTSANPLPRN